MLPSQLTENQALVINFPNDTKLQFIREHGILQLVICPAGSGEGTEESAINQIPIQFLDDERPADDMFTQIVNHPLAKLV